jgi:peptidoglycan/xylan/chitin deacetylase (PgdA/CDA1 family)
MKKKLRNSFSYLFLKFLMILGIVNFRLKYILNNNIPLALYFHNPNQRLFNDIILWFKKRGFNFFSLSEFLENIKKKEKIKGAIWISFDDGYEENINNVLPILEKFKVPATFFIPTKSVEEGFFWWDFAKTKNLPNFEQLWKIPNSERVKIISKKVEKNLTFPKKTITLESLKKLSSNPLVTFGNHTDDHVICINCTDDELKREINLCEKKLISWVGNKYVHVLSYPNGDYNDRVKSTVKKENIKAAFTTEPRLITENVDLFSIPRMGVVDNLSFSENLLHALGIWQPIIKKIKKHNTRDVY